MRLMFAAEHESLVGTFRKCRNVRLESGMRTKADVRQLSNLCVHARHGRPEEFAPYGEKLKDGSLALPQPHRLTVKKLPSAR